jgi:hypothetical protein
VNNCGAWQVAKATTISPIGFLLFDVLDAEFFQLRAQAIKIHAEFSGFQSFAGFLFFLDALSAKRRDFGGVGADHQ